MTSANVYIGTSLDGFIARTDGDIGWLMKFADTGAIEAYNEFIADIDVMVIGRGTFATTVFASSLSTTDGPFSKSTWIACTSEGAVNVSRVSTVIWAS